MLEFFDNCSSFNQNIMVYLEKSKLTNRYICNTDHVRAYFYFLLKVVIFSITFSNNKCSRQV